MRKYYLTHKKIIFKGSIKQLEAEDYLGKILGFFKDY